MDKSDPRGKSPQPVLWDVLRQQPTAVDCAHCMAQLDDYITAQLEGQSIFANFARTAVHLDACLECAQAYALLYEARLAELAQTMTELAHIPAADLSFLSSTAVSLPAQLRRQIQRVAGRVQLQVTAGLLPLLQPLPQAAALRQAAARPQTADSQDGDILLCLTPEHAPEMKLPFTIMAYRDHNNQDICLVEVIVSPPGISWPDLGGRTVTLLLEAEKLTQKTDDWGTAVFAGIPVRALATMQVEAEVDSR